MSIKIDVPELNEILRITPSEQNIMLVGKHGIGKSKIIEDFYHKKKMSLVSFFLGQMSDPGDLIGLMHKDEISGRSIFMPPFWWPKDNNPIVLFFDELNRARPEILQSIMDLTLSKKLAGRKLPEGSIIISAINQGEEYQLTDLDPALISRFNIYEFAPTTEDWLIWADKNGIDDRIIEFIQKNPSFLDGDDKKDLYKDNFYSDLSKSPDRRAWERVSNFIKKIKQFGDIHIKTISGIVGLQAAFLFKKSISEYLNINPKELLMSFAKNKDKLKKLKFNEFIFLNEQIMLWINGEHYPKNKKRTVLNSLHNYIKYLQKQKIYEGIAHFASMFERSTFSKATAFILVESPKIMKIIEEYITDIKM